MLRQYDLPAACQSIKACAAGSSVHFFAPPSMSCHSAPSLGHSALTATDEASCLPSESDEEHVQCCWTMVDEVASSNTNYGSSGLIHGSASMAKVRTSRTTHGFGSISPQPISNQISFLNAKLSTATTQAPHPTYDVGSMALQPYPNFQVPDPNTGITTQRWRLRLEDHILKFVSWTPAMLCQTGNTMQCWQLMLTHRTSTLTTETMHPEPSLTRYLPRMSYTFTQNGVALPAVLALVTIIHLL